VREEPDVSERALDYFPVSFRSAVGYQFTSTTNQATDTGNATIGTGGLLSPEADLIFGTSFGHHVSAFAVATGFGDEGLVNLESIWGRLNSLGTTWLNAKVGRLEVDLPVSEHRSFTLTSPFLIYHYHPTGSLNGY